MVADLRDIIDNSEAVSLDVTWNPTAGMYQARVWHETDRHARGDARNVWMQPPTDWLSKVCCVCAPRSSPVTPRTCLPNYLGSLQCAISGVGRRGGCTTQPGRQHKMLL